MPIVPLSVRFCTFDNRCHFAVCLEVCLVSGVCLFSFGRMVGFLYQLFDTYILFCKMFFVGLYMIGISFQFNTNCLLIILLIIIIELKLLKSVSYLCLILFLCMVVHSLLSNVQSQILLVNICVSALILVVCLGQTYVYLVYVLICLGTVMEITITILLFLCFCHCHCYFIVSFDSQLHCLRCTAHYPNTLS